MINTYFVRIKKHSEPTTSTNPVEDYMYYKVSWEIRKTINPYILIRNRIVFRIYD